MNFKNIIKSLVTYLVLISLYSVGMYNKGVNVYIFSIFEHLIILLSYLPLAFIETSNYLKYKVDSREMYINTIIKNRFRDIGLFWLGILIIKWIMMFINHIEFNGLTYLIYGILLLYELEVFNLILSIISATPNKKHRELIKYCYIGLIFILLLSNSELSLLICPVIISTKFYELSRWWYMISGLSTSIITYTLYRFVNKGDYND